MSSIGEEPPQNCELLGGFGILVQSILGILCFLVLVFKRSIERPKRLWKIFLMDTTKQLTSAVVQHFLNVGLALILSANDSGDECLWYFVTYMLDCTLGVALNFLFLTIFEALFEKLGQRQFQTGNYYKITYPNITTYAISSENAGSTKKAKPKVEVDYGVYLFQLTLWTFIVVLSKVVLYFLQLWLGKYLLQAANFMFEPVAGKPELELIIILVIIPLIFNAFCFWIQDSFLKKNKFQKKEKTLVLDALYEKDSGDVSDSSSQSNGEVELQIQMQTSLNENEESKESEMAIQRLNSELSLEQEQQPKNE